MIYSRYNMGPLSFLCVLKWQQSTVQTTTDHTVEPVLIVVCTHHTLHIPKLTVNNILSVCLKYQILIEYQSSRILNAQTVQVSCRVQLCVCRRVGAVCSVRLIYIRIYIFFCVYKFTYCKNHFSGIFATVHFLFCCFVNIMMMYR